MNHVNLRPGPGHDHATSSLNHLDRYLPVLLNQQKVLKYPRITTPIYPEIPQGVSP